MKVVIVGNGIAGNQVAFQVRAGSREEEICIVSAESVPEYDPCSLPYYLGGDVGKKAVFRKRLEDYQSRKIDLLLNNKVVSIAPEAKSIVTETGLEIGYDKLVLAHGGDLFIPPIDGIRKKGIFSCKDLAGTEELLAHNGREAVVIGSGAIGIEVSEALKKIGYQVTIVELLDWILPVLFDRETAVLFESALTGYGLRVLTSEKVIAVEGREKAEAVVTDRRTIPCDTVVIATGVVPGISLAKTAGIRVERGIKVDEYMQTSMPDIFACGDCIETVDLCTGEDAMFQLKHNALDQAGVAAANILGRQSRYSGAYAFARVHFGRTHAVSFGKTTLATRCRLGELDIVEKGGTGDYLRLIIKDDLIVGGQAIGRYADSMGFFFYAMRRQDDLTRLRKAWSAPGAPRPHQPWPQRLIGELIGPD